MSSTMEKALGRAAPLLGGIEGDPGSIASRPPGDLSADTGGGDTSYTGGGLRDVLGRNKDQISALQGRLADLDTRSDALVPPKMVEPPKPPEQRDTPMEQRWGSVAMTLAAFGGLLTRTPLTASLNAMAQVNHAFNEGDATAAKTAFETWKVQNENAMKMNAFSIKAYEDSLRKIGIDRQGALAEIRANAAALKDDVVLHLLDSGQTDAALGVLGARPQQTAALQDRTEKLQQQHDALTYWMEQHPNATPPEVAQAASAFRAGKDPDTPPPGLNEEREETAVVNEKTTAWKAMPGNEGKEPSAEQRLQWRHEAKAGGKPQTGAANKEAEAHALALQKFRDAHAGADPGPADAAEMAKLTGAERQHQATQAGRTAQMLQRSITSGLDAVADIANIVEMPMTVSRGMLAGRTQGPSLIDATKEVLANTVTSEEAQAYNVALAGVSRAMGGLATGGLAVDDHVMRSYENLDIKEGDTNLIKLRKIATMRQNTENAIDALISNPALTDKQLEQVTKMKGELEKSVPYTVHDVNQVQFAQNPSAKLSDFAKTSGVDRSTDHSKPQQAAPKDGDTATSKSGKPMIYRGGQWQYQ